MDPDWLLWIILLLVFSFSEYGDSSTKRRPPFLNQEHCAYVDLKYRQLDGTCNHWRGYGSAGKPVKRYLKPHYQDGIDKPRSHSVLGKRFPLPSPRLVSLKIHPDHTETSRVTLLVMQFGQLIDHDVTMSPTPADNGQDIKCCGIPKRKQSSQCFTIPIPEDDPVFKMDCMEFVRSHAALNNRGKTITPREQINDLTSFIDASSIYGNDVETMLKLRTQLGTGALLKTKNVLGKARLPIDPAGDCVLTKHAFSYCQMSGDHRVNEQPALSSIHLVFHKRHNLIVQSLAKGILKKRLGSKRNPKEKEINDFIRKASNRKRETLFQETRKIMSGILQKITYCDWLPTVLGPRLIRKYGLECDTESTYNPSVDPRISNVFLTAAFRFGHSLIPDQILVNYKLKDLQEIFSVPDSAILYHESIIYGLCEGNMSRPFDRFISKAVTSNLFRTSKRFLDLIALNIQRGRDHGIPSYFHWRKHLGLRGFSGPEDFGSKKMAKTLRSIFAHPYDIDLFTAALLEKPVHKGMVGETFGNILGQQFSDLKKGDAYFFLSKDKPEGFTKAQRESLLQVNLGQLLCSDSKLSLMQFNPFMEMSLENPLVSCKNPTRT